MMDEPQILWRPVTEDSPTDNAAYRKAAPPARIVGIVAVVPHHEDAVWLDHGRWLRIAPLLKNVRLIERLAVNPHLATHDLQTVTGQSNDPFDKIPLWSIGVMKDDDIAALYLSQSVIQLADHQELPFVQVGFHARSLDAIVLHEQTNNREGDKGEQQRLKNLTQEL